MTIPRSATAVLCAALFALPVTASAQSASDVFQRALRVERVEGNLEEAIRLYGQVVDLDDRTLAARALLRIGESYERLGRQGAEAAYQRLVNEFADQMAEAGTARDRLATLTADAPDRLGPDAARGADGLSLRLVWADAAGGGPTPDGKGITFVDPTNSGLAVRDLATGNERVLVTDGIGTTAYPLESSVSNDGRHVAYGFVPGPWQPQLRIVRMDGTDQRILLENASVEIDYITPNGWTPDDSEVLVDLLWMDGHSSLTFVSTADGSMRTVRSFATGDVRGGALSPDGRWIAYTQLDEDSWLADIVLIASDGSTESMVVSHPANDRAPLWSPDGRHLLFASDRGGSIDLWAVRVSDGAADSDPFLVRRDIGAMRPLAFASDGSLLLRRTTTGGDIFTVEFDAQESRVRDKPTHAVQTYQGHNSGGAWTPDGTRLAYASRRQNRFHSAGNKASLIVRDEASGREFEPAPNVVLHPTRSQPALSPNGERIAAWAELLDAGTADVEIQLIDVADGTTRTMDHPGGVCHFCVTTFSNDGSALYDFDIIARPGIVPGDACPEEGCAEYRGLVRHDLASGQHERVFEMDFTPNGDRGAWALSPDETKVVMLSRDAGGTASTFRIGDLRTGTTTHVTTIEHAAAGCTPASRNNPPAWTPDGSRILFVCDPPGTDDGSHMHELMSVPATGGPVQSAGLVMEQIRHMTIRPDGTIGFTAGPRRSSEVWVMSGLLTETALSGSR